MTFQEFMAKVEAKNPGEPEFIQAVSEVVESIWDVYESNPRFVKANVLERLVEPERVIIFRVPWMDDKGEVHVQRGYRVQFNSAIGPYKGGLRFHPSVNLSVLKFLGFEQIFKNSLTSLPLGGGKGGSDFDPRGKSDEEIMRFCQSFMAELFRHIGPNTDVPAGDIGVGAREVGYLFGYYKKLMNEFTGVLTGKGINWGGSLIRPEATGFGIVYFTEEVLNTIGETIKGKRVAVSGFGNVAWGAVQKVNDLGGKVVTLSGPDGYIYDEDGVSGEKIDFMVTMRNSNRDLVQDYADKYPSAKFFPGKHPWEVPVDVAMPCATQNELNEQDAMNLINNKCICVVEGANMPCVPKAIEAFQKAKILFAPGKAANAGGVATSGLEMTQNAMHLSWPREEVDARLHEIMKNIHKACVEHGKEPDGYINYVKGANIAGFMKVANAMCDQGLV
ncbi:MAG TPA: NADP-specific glutamate dehydrogenase [Candidatus Syntrophosphaera sp.]|nr:NADP-specific glutamate dehydrogenase [Candidatus Syntrophosphaera sp.]HRU47612.1 NADP-specific glutamate dehydrogenase [Candidatus Syntrophosphaera sp.]